MPAWSPAAFRRIVLASALYDLLVTAPFATPWTFDLVHGQLNALNLSLGGPALPVFGPVHTLFALLLGSLVVVWAAVRLGSPEVRLGRHDAAGRLLFSLWMTWALAQGQVPVLGVFLLPELAWAVAQLLPVRAR